MQRVSGARLELGYEILIEVSGLCRVGVDKQSPTSNWVAHVGDAVHDILQETCSESASFVCLVHAKASEKRHRLGIPRGSLAKPRGRGLYPNLGHRPGVVGDDLQALGLGDDEHLRRTRATCLKSVASQPDRLLVGSTGKRIAHVLLLKERWSKIAHDEKGEGRFTSRLSPGKSFAGRALSASHSA